MDPKTISIITIAIVFGIIVGLAIAGICVSAGTADHYWEGYRDAKAETEIKAENPLLVLPSPKHAFTCPACMCHRVDFQGGVYFCHQCHVMVEDSRPKHQRSEKPTWRAPGDWPRRQMAEVIAWPTPETSTTHPDHGQS